MLQRFETVNSGRMAGIPALPLAWAETGMECARQGDIPGALACLQRAVAIDDECYEGWLGLTGIFEVMKEHERAVRCLSVARSIRGRLGRHDPDRATA